MASGVSLCRTDFMARSRPARADTTTFNPQEETASMPFTSTSGFQAKPTLLRLLICASLGLGSPYLFAQASPATANGPALQAKTDLAQFVQHNLQSRVNGLPQEFPLDIADIQDLKDAKIGYGFQVYTIDPGDIVAGRGELRSMVKPTGIWRFTITLNERPIGLATLEQVAGKWETVAYGAAVLAKDLEASMVAYANSDRSNVRFVRVYQAQSDFLEVVSAEDAKTRFAPLHSARLSLLFKQKAKGSGVGARTSGEELLEANELLEPLRVAVRKNMDANRQP
jgi:hypothetical protein